MTIANLPVSVQYTGNGSLTTYSFSFQIFFNTDVLVYLGDTLKTLTTDYTVTFTAGTAGGNVVFGSAPANGIIITIVRSVADARSTTYAQDGEFISTVVNADFDRLTAKDQEHDYLITERSIVLDPTDPSATLTLPLLSTRAGKLLAFDSSGNLTTSVISLPGTLTPTDYVRVNTAGTGYELRTQTQTLSDLNIGTIASQSSSSVSITGGTITSATVTGLASPSGASDATNKQYVDNALAGVASRGDVRVATTANITLSGTQTIDGVSLSVGNRVLVKNQTSAAQNGVYDVASGTWSYDPDYSTWAEVASAVLVVNEGSTLGTTLWMAVGPASGTLGTTVLNFSQINPGPGGNVVGPSSSTDEHVVLFSGTSGLIIEDSGTAFTSVWSTGDAKLTFKTTADSGWIMANDGTIGSASSGATYANANAQALFTLFWTNISNTYCPVSGGRGGSASADWAANKMLTIPLSLGRALAVSGSGSGLSARTLGQTVGEETHTLNATEQASMSVSGNSAAAVCLTPSGASIGAIDESPNVDGGAIYNEGLGVSGTASGGGGAHNNMQPTTFLNVMIKL